jgi:hypothetical protein
MRRRLFLTAVVTLPLAVAGLVYGQTLTQRQAEKPQKVEAKPYTCPVTGEELPCPNCCPYNQQK